MKRMTFTTVLHCVEALCLSIYRQCSPFLRGMNFVLLLFLLAEGLQAQSNLSTAPIPQRINFDNNDKVQDFKIPNVGGRISFTLNGGDGGRRRVPNLCTRKGGQGATIQAIFMIGPGTDRLNPGGTLRFIPGQKGESRGGNGPTGAGGGGGSGLLYTTASDLNSLPGQPSLDLADAGTSWVILAVAGGGGGAGLNGLCDGRAGIGGSTGTNGIESAGGDDAGVDGGGAATAGGGGYDSDAGQGGEYSGKKGGITGGRGGGVNAKGGFGYGGGGSGNILLSTGGGGGGFSGGAAGDFNEGGGGGGSFVTGSATGESKQGGGRTNNPRSGYIEYILEDTNSPVAVCNDLLVELDANGQKTVLPEDADGGSYDPNGDDNQLTFEFGQLSGLPNGGFGIITYESLPFDCNNIGEINNTIALFVTDEEGAQGACYVNFNIEDNLPPTPQCKTDLVFFPDASRTITINAEQLDNGSTDNCGAPLSFTFDDGLPSRSFTCEETGVYDLPINVVDASDNVSTCTARIEIKQFVNECAPDFCVEIPANQNEVFVDIPEPPGPIGCGIVLRSRIFKDGVPQSGFTTTDKSGNYTFGEYAVIWQFFDQSRGAPLSICSTNFTVRQQGPLTCAPGFTVDISGNSCEAFVEIPEPIAGVPCDNFLLESRVIPRSGSASPGFPNSDASDKSGNYGIGEYLVFWLLSIDGVEQECQTRIFVNDNETPNAVCKNFTVQLDDSGMGNITTDDIDNGSNDACGIKSLSLDQTSFGCDDVGTNTVTLTVTDNNDLVATCTATVTVVDPIAPEALCQNTSVQLGASGMVSISTTDINNGSNDACGIKSLSLDQTSFGCDDVGSNTVTLTVTDNNDLVSTCMATVTVVDPIAPEALCQNTSVQLDASGMGSISTTDIDNGSNDACGIKSLSLDQTSFDCGDLGSKTVTLTVTDNNDLVASCTATVTVEDNIPPMALCSTDPVVVLLDGSGTGSLPANAVVGFSTDNCGDLSQTSPAMNYTCTDLGMQMVELTVEDAGGNVIRTDCEIRVEDVTPPVAMCQDIVVEIEQGGEVSIIPDQIDDSSTFGFCGVNFSLDKSTFTCAEEGANTVMFTVSNQAGQSSSCSATVTVEINLGPTARCKNSIAARMSQDGNTAFVDIGRVNNGSFDACGSLIGPDGLMLDKMTVTPGNNVVTLTVTDARGRTDQCMTTVLINDTEAPDENGCVGSFTVNLDENGSYELFAEELDNGTTDNSGEVSFFFETVVPTGDGLQTVFVPSFTYTCDFGAIDFVRVIAFDGNENSSVCAAIAQIRVEDNISPEAKCQDVTVELGENGQGTLTPVEVDNGSTDNCDQSLNLALSRLSFSCSDVGTQSVTLTVTDDDGNSSTCQALVEVEDNVKPTVVCPTEPPLVQLDMDGQGSLAANALAAGLSMDNCGIASESSQMANFDCMDAGTQMVLLTAVDINGNEDSKECAVVVQDNIDPMAVCPETTPVVQLGADGNGVLPVDALAAGLSTDNCGIASETSPETSFTCTQIGTQQVLLTVVDVNSNEDELLCDVLIEDKVLPTVVCPETAPVVQLGTDGMGVLPVDALAAGRSTDNCGVPVESSQMANFDCMDVGTQMVLLTAVDGNGNEDSKECAVLVQDNIDPTAVCPETAPIVLLGENGQGSLAANALAASLSMDNCGIASETSPQTSFDCAHIGTQQVMLTVLDVNGNEDELLCDVLVQDKVLPTVICPETAPVVQLDADGNGSLPADALTAGRSTDNCSVPVESSPLTNFDCSDVGAVDVLLTAEDANGNRASQFCTVTIEDNQAPTLNCTDRTIQLDASGSVNIIPQAILNDFTEACGTNGFGTLSKSSFTCADVGDNLVTLSLADINGNTGTCNVTITVEDIKPDAQCKDISVQLDASGMANITTADIDNGSNDACGIKSLSLDQTSFGCSDVGSNTVTLTVTDNNDQVSTCMATVTVVDNITPEALCQNTSVQLDASGVGSITTADINNNSNDACGIKSLSLDQTSFGCSDVGSNTVTLTVTDNNDQVSTCMATVTVVDNIAPEALCQNTSVQLDASGVGSITTADINNNSNDACGIKSLSLDQTDFGCSDVGSNTVTLTVTDNNNQVSTCMATVTVADEIKPDAQCKDISVQLDENGMASINPSEVNNSSSDACGIQDLTLDKMDFSCADIGLQEVTLTVIDESDNTNICTAMVRVLASDFCADPTITNEGGPSIADPCTCSATPGYFDEEVVINSNNPGEDWRILSVTGLVDPNDFPNEFSTGNLFVDNGDGTYGLVGMHASGVGYSIVAVSDFYPDARLMVSNLCNLPELADVGADTRVCSNDPLGISLSHVSTTTIADRFEVSRIELGDAVQLEGITAGMSSTSPELLSDMVFEYSGMGIATVKITVVPYNTENCAGPPLVIPVQVEPCVKPVAELPVMNLRILLIYLTVVVSVGLFAGFRIDGTA